MACGGTGDQYHSESLTGDDEERDIVAVGELQYYECCYSIWGSAAVLVAL